MGSWEEGGTSCRVWGSDELHGLEPGVYKAGGCAGGGGPAGWAGAEAKWGSIGGGSEFRIEGCILPVHFRPPLPQWAQGQPGSFSLRDRISFDSSGGPSVPGVLDSLHLLPPIGSSLILGAQVPTIQRGR